MNLLIIDDAIASARTLETTLRTLLPQLDEIHIAASGEELADCLKQNTYGIAMISGSDREEAFGTAWRLYEEREETVTIIYGGFESDQDYKHMMHNHVYDYVSMPVTKTALHFTMEAAMAEVEHRKKKLMVRSEERYQKVEQLVEFSFIYSVLFNGELSWNFDEYQTMFGIKDTGYVLYISLERSEEEKQLPYDIYSQIIKQNVTSGYFCMVGKEVTRRIIVFVMCLNKKEHIGSKMEQIRFGEYIRKAFRDTFGVTVKVGIGSERTIDKLPISYEEAMRNLRFDGYPAYGAGVGNETDQRSQEKFCFEQEQKFLTNIREGNQEALNNMRAILEVHEGNQLHDRKNKIIELLVMASHIARYDGKNENEYTNYIELVRQLDELDESALNAWACRSVTYIIKSIRDLQTVSSFSDIRKSLRYVDTHYDEDISLEEVASVINVSPQYFSRIFKEKTGITFVDYLTKVRIRKAKEWLSYSENTIQEICYKVGYKDPNYFARVFKKIVGITPKQFKASKESSDVS